MKNLPLIIITVILYLALKGGLSMAKNTDVEEIEVFKQVVEVNPDDALAHVLIGNAYYN